MFSRLSVASLDDAIRGGSGAVTVAKVVYPVALPIFLLVSSTISMSDVVIVSMLWKSINVHDLN